MPLDKMHSYDDLFYDRMIGAEYKFAWLPQTCHLSGKRIWLKKGYCLYRLITGPGDAIIETRWHEKHEHLIWKLTR